MVLIFQCGDQNSYVNTTQSVNDYNFLRYPGVWVIINWTKIIDLLKWSSSNKQLLFNHYFLFGIWSSLVKLPTVKIMKAQKTLIIVYWQPQCYGFLIQESLTLLLPLGYCARAITPPVPESRILVKFDVRPRLLRLHQKIVKSVFHTEISLQEGTCSFKNRYTVC